MMAGLAGMDCWMWSFKPPRSSSRQLRSQSETEGPSSIAHSHIGSTGYGSATMSPLAAAASSSSWQQGDMMSAGASPLAQEDGRKMRTVRPAKPVVKRANNNRFPKRK